MYKKSLISGIIIVLIFVTVGYFSIKKMSSPSQKGSLPSGMEEWIQISKSLSANIASFVIDPVLDNDTYVLTTFVSDIKKNTTGFEYLIIVNKEGKILFHPDSTQIMQDYNPGELKPLEDQKNLIQSIKRGEQDIYDIASPIMLVDTKQGEVHLGLKNPWQGKTAKTNDNLPKILFIIAALFGIILAIVGSVGVAPPSKTAVPSISKEEIAKLETNKKELESNISKLKKEFETLSKKKEVTTGNETEMSKRIAQLRNEETKLLKSVDEKKAALTKLEHKIEAMSQTSSSSEIKELMEQLGTKDKEINNLKAQIKNIKAQKETEGILEEVPAGDLDEMKKEELEITQRIVKKRREEIILSQRVETKRKEELALERKIEALQKKLKEIGSSS